jgi:hypothetical protein
MAAPLRGAFGMTDATLLQALKIGADVELGHHVVSLLLAAPDISQAHFLLVLRTGGVSVALSFV